MKLKIFLLLVLLLGGGAAVFSIKNYSLVFAKTVRGAVVRVERVNTGDAILGSRNIPDYQLFSYAVAIRDEEGEIHTASSVDRQWAVVASGQCAQARFFPYPPWDFEKAGTYFGARLERLFDCKEHPRLMPTNP